METPTRFPAIFVLGWIAWIMTLLTAEFFLVNAPYVHWMWGGCLVYFAVLEGVAVKRRGTGDTFSESVWGFYNGRTARAFLVFGVSGWLSVRLFSFGLEDIDLGIDPLILGRVFLIGGFFVWLVLHFLYRGRHG